MRSLILNPNFTFERLASWLTSRGWQLEPDPNAPESILPDEPEAAVFTLPNSDLRLLYNFHPAMYLRVMVAEGSDADSLLENLRQQLPTLTRYNLRYLLTSDTITDLLLGIQAVVALHETSLLEPLNDLTKHQDPLIAREAHAAALKLLQKTATDSLYLLKALQPDPNRSILFPAIQDVQERRQILRWFIRERNQTNDHINSVLRAALADRDWEVQVTAMLAALRLNAVELRQQVAKVDLPERIQDGVDSVDQRVLKALKKAVLMLLEGNPLPDYTTAPLVDRDAMQAHIWRCAAGVPVAWHDRVFLLVHALTSPIQISDQLVPYFPPGVRTEDDGAWLGDIALTWVPPIPHWLGDELVNVPLQHPIRQSTPENGFFIAEMPLSNENGILKLTWEQAQQHCRQLSQQFNVPVRLPYADEWEMAARGPDGRRFPWGNAYTSNFKEERSPWGLRCAVGVVPQWTVSASPNNIPLLCGGVKQLRCSVRIPVSQADILAGIRVVVS